MEKEILSELRKIHAKLDKLLAAAQRLWPKLFEDKNGKS